MVKMQNNKGIWLPLIASVGVGAATYYTMTKNNSNLGQTVSKIVPLVAAMGSTNQNKVQRSESGQLGPFGMS